MDDSGTSREEEYSQCCLFSPNRNLIKENEDDLTTKQSELISDGEPSHKLKEAIIWSNHAKKFKWEKLEGW